MFGTSICKKKKVDKVSEVRVASSEVVSSEQKNVDTTEVISVIFIIRKKTRRRVELMLS